MKGYQNKIIRVDLTTKTIQTEELNPEFRDLFLGGAGYGTAVLLEELDKATEPLSPENLLIFMTGPLTGTLAPNTSRMIAVTKSPLSGLLAESNCGGTIALQLKKAGYDGLILSGKAETPVYLEIIDDKVELKDATELWGKSVYETHDILKNSVEGLKPRQIHVMCIGPAGENLVKYAIVASEERAFGRTGCGAVMGSKNLKAVIFHGTGQIEKAKPEEFKTHNREVIKNLLEVFTVQMFKDLGTSGSVDMYNVSGELPIKYWQQGEFDGAYDISGSTLQEEYLKKNRHCGSCVIGCGREVVIDKYEDVPKEPIEGPEYETIAGFGSMMLNEDLGAIVKCNYICNNLGLDTISASSTIALAMDLVEKGVMSADDLDGIDLGWGKMDAVYTLLSKIANREGVGDLLAEETVALAKKFDYDLENVASIKNISVTYHDARASFGMVPAYAISPMGPNHNACDMYITCLGQPYEEIGIDAVEAQTDGEDMSIAAARLHDYRALYSSIGMCVFCNPPAPDIAKYMELTLGVDFGLEEIKDFGRRSFLIKRLFNLKMGMTRDDERYPKILLQSLEDSGQEGKVPDAEKLIANYYKYREWDEETLLPPKSVFTQLKMENYIP